MIKSLKELFVSKSVNASGRKVRGDIQALRAVAVGVVIINHLSAYRLTGGYIGVDVFFVISGFLITMHLYSQLQRNDGKVKLISFYAKRVRRLLPAAFTVISLSAIATYLLMPFDKVANNIYELLASTFYVENLYLAVKAVDYHAQGGASTLAQHYWSLSVEEQFYLLWPVLLMLFYWIAKKLEKPRIFVALIAVFGLTSLAYCIYFTNVSLAQAYFFTPVRFWEFSAGALIAVGAPVISNAYIRLVMAVLGWIGIFGSSFFFEAHSAFPGYIALLPVISTALVIWAGNDGQIPLLHHITDLYFVRLIGDISYSLYLWHWPLIVLAPFAFGVPTITLKHKLIIVVVTFVLSLFSKTYIEDAGVRSKILAKNAKVTFTAMIVVMGIIAGGGYAITVQSRIEAENYRIEYEKSFEDSCFGAKAVTNPECKNIDAKPTSLVMDDDINDYAKLPKECVDVKSDEYLGSVVKNCNFGDDKSEKVMMVGDSHIEHWNRDIFYLAEKEKWNVLVRMQGGCPTLNYTAIENTSVSNECVDYSRNISDYVLKEKPKYIFYSNFARNEDIQVPQGSTKEQEFVKQLPVYWKQWADNGSKVIVVADVPYISAEHPAYDCLKEKEENPKECALPYDKVVSNDPLRQAVAQIKDPNIKLLDMTDLFCPDNLCRVSVGAVPVYYKDNTHLNAVFVTSTKEIFAKRYEKLFKK